MSDHDDSAQMEILDTLVQHLGRLRQRAIASGVLFAVCVVTSLIVAFDRRLLEDPITLTSAAFFICAMFVLPRDYLPRVLRKHGGFPEGELVLDQCRSLERIGRYQRIIYLVVAGITFGLLPWLLNHYEL